MIPSIAYVQVASAVQRNINWAVELGLGRRYIIAVETPLCRGYRADSRHRGFTPVMGPALLKFSKPVSKSLPISRVILIPRLLLSDAMGTVGRGHWGPVRGPAHRQPP